MPALGNLQISSPCTEGKETLKRETAHSRLVGGMFNKEENFLKRHVLDNCKTSSLQHPPGRILKVYVDDLTGFSNTIRPHGLNNTLLCQGCVLEMAANVGIAGRAYISRLGRRFSTFISPT